MVDFALLMLILIFVIPILMVILTWVSKPSQHTRIGLAGLGLVLLGVGVLALGGEVDLDPGWVFMQEPITFSITSTAIWLFFATVLALAGKIWQGRGTVDPAMTPYQWMMVYLSVSFGLVAFFSGQFMVRYIALDIVGLLAALTVLSTFSATAGTRAFILMFQILRLGDLSLLASILLLNHLTGTLEISPMIAGAVDLPPGMRLWVALGFLLAILIKAAIWPFGLWLRRARQHAPRISFWTSGLLLPALGYYLLYRITPILQSGGIFQNLALSVSLALALMPILFTAL
ncbi:MAG: proton-conducting transporter membrane subunit, partial [Brevefilum sp.]